VKPEPLPITNLDPCWMGMSESASNNESPNLHPVFLCERWNDTVQAQVLDKLSVMVGDVPDGNHGDAEFGVRSGIAAFDTVERAKAETGRTAQSTRRTRVLGDCLFAVKL
jgi:hypothetical protein